MERAKEQLPFHDQCRWCDAWGRSTYHGGPCVLSQPRPKSQKRFVYEVRLEVVFEGDTFESDAAFNIYTTQPAAEVEAHEGKLLEILEKSVREFAEKH